MTNRLQEIRTELLSLDKAFFAVPERERGSPATDVLRNRARALRAEAEALTQLPQLSPRPPGGFFFGHPALTSPADFGYKMGKSLRPRPVPVAYAIRILPSEHAPVESWGKVIAGRNNEEWKKNLAAYGLEMQGEFLMPIGSPGNVRYAVRRDFLVGKDNKSDLRAFRRWYKSYAGGTEMLTARGREKKPKLNLTDRFMAEVILYGGIPMTRADVYRAALEDTGDKKAADLFAFRNDATLAPVGAEPLTVAEFREADKATKEDRPLSADIARKWATVYPKEIQERLKSGGVQPKLAGLKWSELEPWVQALLRDSLVKRSGGETVIKSEKALETALAKTAIKEAWQMTRAEYKESVKREWLADYKARPPKRLIKFPETRAQLIADDAIGSHKGFIRQALSEGKPVPAEVLAEYPDLAEPQTGALNTKPPEIPRKWATVLPEGGAGTSQTEGATVQTIESSRTARSRDTDESREHSLILEPDDPRVETVWMRDPGRADVRGVDTKRKQKPKRSGKRTTKPITEMGRMRR